MMCTADQIGDGSPFGRGGGFGGGPFGGFGGRRALLIDEETLTAVADRTGARYFRAQDAGELNKALAGLPKEIGLHKEKVEISVWFVLAGALLAFLGVGLSLWWNRAPGVKPTAARLRASP
jgi:Ca-activated chloride channel family protein